MTRFKIRDFELAGRTGVLYTKSGPLETPAFFPVVDPIRQEVAINDIVEVGFKQVITNAYLLYKRAQREGITDKVDVHKVLNFDGVIMTDSGAYQLLEYGNIDLGQETIVNFERQVGSDIAVILDHPTGDVGRRDAERSVEETLRNARSALEMIKDDESTVWVLPIQGGKYLDLVRRSAEESSRLPYPMYGVGSPTVFMERYRYDIVVKMIGTAKQALPPERPVHLFGAGHP
nr:putative tRNA-guanine transglycosylase ITB [uncultured archaeon]